MNVGNYVNRKTGNVVKVVEVDEKTKTLIYEGADGKTHSISWSSFRKSYKSEGAPVNEEPKPVEKTEEKQDDIKNDDKPVEKKEKSEKLKKERIKKPKNEENVNALVQYIVSTVEHIGGTVKIPRSEDMKFRALCKDGKQFCKLMWSVKSIKLFTRNSYGEYAPQVINYNLPNVYEFINITADDKKHIADILKRAYNDTNIKSKKVKEAK